MQFRITPEGEQKSMMRKIVSLFVACLVAVLNGCTAADTIAAGISEKAISGEGMFGGSKIGIDAATKAPTLQGILVRGNYTSVPAGIEFIEYSESTDRSIWNPEAFTYKKRLVFGSAEQKHMDEVVKAVGEQVKTPVNGQ
jgi:hypothetical protein